MALVYIASQTASSSATLSFTSGIDSLYNEYHFHMVNMHPANDNVHFQFQVNAAGASGFDEVMTTSVFESFHHEGTLGYSLEYYASTDQAQGNAYQILSRATGNDNDQAASGILTLYDPSSTTYIKHFTSAMNGSYYNEYTMNDNVGGYINVTAAIDEISFQFSSGNIDSGTIHMYGVSQ
jgi:hypothetical protein